MADELVLFSLCRSWNGCFVPDLHCISVWYACSYVNMSWPQPTAWHAFTNMLISVCVPYHSHTHTYIVCYLDYTECWITKNVNTCCTSSPLYSYLLSSEGQEDEKGKVMGIFRSMGALARALGPVMACSGEGDLCNDFLCISSLPPPTTPSVLELWCLYLLHDWRHIYPPSNDHVSSSQFRTSSQKRLARKEYTKYY